MLKLVGKSSNVVSEGTVVCDGDTFPYELREHGKLNVLILSESAEKRVRIEKAYIRVLKALDEAGIFTAERARQLIQENRIHFVMYHTNLFGGTPKPGSYRMEFNQREPGSVDFEIQRINHEYLPKDTIPVPEPVELSLLIDSV